MYSDTLARFFHSRAHAGNLENPTHSGTAGTPGHGPYIKIFLRAPQGVIETARFLSYGCPAALGCASAVCSWSEGQTLDAARKVTAQDVTSWVDGVPEGKEHCPPLAAQALVIAATRSVQS